MKKIITLTLALSLALILVISLAACGEKTDAEDNKNSDNSKNSSDSQGDNAASDNNNGDDEIDLSQFTPKELPDSSLLEEWMKPEFGVITSGGETLKDFMFQFTVSGVTKANEESYRQLIESEGFTKSSDYTYTKDGIKIALGTAGIGTTSDSIMTVTVEKS